MDIFTDGSGKTGKYAYVIPHKNLRKIMQKRGLTNNEAEYMGVILALKDFNDKEIIIHSDSQLIVNQLKRNWKIKESRLKSLATEVWKLCEGRNVDFKWVPREKNWAGKLLG